MKDEFFVDTNILVYAFDESEPAKRKTAKRIVEEATSGKVKGVVSNQVLGELYNALTRKIEKPIDTRYAQIIVNGILDSKNWGKVDYKSITVSKAIETSINEKKPFWDSVLIETMLENKIYTLITENTADFSNPKIKIVNPFKEQKT
ncbi:MAG TPA: PIN domain-containing protein [archaeon]|nr:PIN domain-containing protein [archaeon]